MLELVVQAPPLVNRNVSVGLFLVAVFALLASICARSLAGQSTFSRPAAMAVGVCIAVIGAIGLRENNGVWGALLPGYVAMLVAARFVEGCLVGLVVRRHGRWWHSVIVAVAVLAAALMLENAEPAIESAIKLGWSGGMAVLASYQMTRMVRDSSATSGMFNGGLLFTLFVAIHLYLPHERLAWILYMAMFPLGLVVGLVGATHRSLAGSETT